MFEHDTGYDECGHCDFFVIYYPETWSTNDEYRMILERQAATWRERCNDLGGPGFPGEEQASPHSLKRTWPPSDKQLDAVAQLLGADPGGWTKTIRASGLLEHVCEHGVGHPDPASAATLGDGYSIHGCDGCCGRDDFPGKRQA